MKLVLLLCLFSILTMGCNKDGSIFNSGNEAPFISIQGDQHLGVYQDPQYGKIDIFKKGTNIQISFGAKNIKKRKPFKYMLLYAKVMNKLDGENADFIPIDANNFQFMFLVAGEDKIGISSGDSFEYESSNYTFDQGIYELKLNFTYEGRTTSTSSYIGIRAE